MSGIILLLIAKSDVWEMGIREQAEYADSNCIENVNNKDFHDQQLFSFHHDRREYEIWNDTSIGNLAFLSLQAPEEYRQSYKTILNDYIAWKHDQSYFCIIL